MGRHLKKWINQTIALTVMLVLLVSCLGGEGANTTRKAKSTSNTTTPTTNTGVATPPTFDSNLNTFQIGSSSTSGKFSIEINFSDFFYFRGKEVSSFISKQAPGIVQCLLVDFPNLTVPTASKTLVMALSPRSFFNFSNSSVEYYFLVSPADTSFNSGNCQTPGIINYAATNYPNSSLVYDLKSVCINCIQSQLDSKPVALTSKSGVVANSVNTSYLSIQLKTANLSSTIIGSACSGSSECLSKGFDCCSLGQCVKDKSLKPNIDLNSSAFLQSQADINLNPNNISNYPEFYFLCGSNTTAPAPNPTSTDPDTEQAKRFTEMKRLFECTTRVEGEMSICTKTYKLASKNLEDFKTSNDDRNFNSTYTGPTAKKPPSHSIVEIIHANQTLFKDNTPNTTSPKFGINDPPGTPFAIGNDDLNHPVTIYLNNTPDPSADNDDLIIRYKIDGSCTKINSALAKCLKFYVQGQQDGKITDHHPASNQFLIPYYADTTRNTKVTVDGNLKFVGTDYQVIASNPPYVQFLGAGLKVFDTQAVEIEYFVNLNSFNVLQEKETSLLRISEICQCVGTTCSLKEIYDEFGTNVVDYACVYPQPETPVPPLQVTVTISSKSAPHRYYDTLGIYQSEVNVSSPEQEGTKFEYTKDDLLKPNNLDKHVGFNEIYGSFTTKPTSAKPAKQVVIQQGKTYDIFTDRGTYSSCFFCGNDYWSQFTKIFPSNFNMNGGGYRPEPTTTDRTKPEFYRADDFLFGRACWIPATMIPWTHQKNSDTPSQRRNRLAAQHLLFANGYQRDWYGFDYGSVIGSFDGVTWFSVGNQRRIKATSNRLYLAINSYFSDLTQDSNYTITVSEANLTFGSGSQITTDDASDGAECRKYHMCEKDSDCITQLGWDYACENVTQMKTNWPVFDSNGLEIPDQEQSAITLSSLVKNITGKRCVYRGRGAPCITNYLNVSDQVSYNGLGSTNIANATHVCSTNNYCQRFQQGGLATKFNNKISRYGKSVATQNSTSTVSDGELDTFGMGVRSIGRPLEYNGKEAIESSSALSNLSANKINAICVPGRRANYTDTDSLLTHHGTAPTQVENERFEGDQVTGQGMTRQDSSLSVAMSSPNPYYFASCPLLTSDGQYLFRAHSDKTLVSANVFDGAQSFAAVSGSQTTSTNALDIFNSFHFQDIDLLKHFSNQKIDAPHYQYNRCLRTPGSVCHTDQDCAANPMIAKKLASQTISKDVFNGTGDSLNYYEALFWQNEMICSNGSLPTDQTPKKITENRCCRAIGKEISTGQSLYATPPDDDDPEFPQVAINSTDSGLPGTQISFNDVTRNTALSGAIKELNASTIPALSYAHKDSCKVSAANCVSTERVKNNYKTLQKINSNMCCGGHWVRNFHETNGGGHVWHRDKHQKIPVSTFACKNWLPITGGEDRPGTPFTCESSETAEILAPSDGACLARTVVKAEANSVMRVLEKFELLGIPQIHIETHFSAPITGASSPLACISSRDDQEAIGAGQIQPMPGLLNPVLTNAFSQADFFDDHIDEFEYKTDQNDADDATDTTLRLSAADPANFNTEGDIKMIFSDDSYTCCRPVGEFINIQANESPSNCCTGTVAADGRCALADYTDISVYFNPYVSSELKDLEFTDSIDEETGYFKDNKELDLAQIACSKRACISNRIAFGVVWSQLHTPPFEGTNDERITRFIQREGESDGVDAFYDIGLKWNIHAYCYPSGDGGGGGDNLPLGFTIMNCN